MKRKRIFYIPGLISITLLPVLLFIWGPEDYQYQTAMKLNMPSYAKDVTNSRFTVGNVYQAMRHKKVVTIDIGVYNQESEEYIESRKLEFITNEIERLQFTNDTTTVLKVEFGDECNYGTFMWVLNHALVYNFKRYALVDNSLYFFPEPRHFYTVQTLESAGSEYTVPEQQTISWWEDFKLNLQYKWNSIQYQWEYLFNQQQQNKVLAIGFLILVILPGIIKMRRNFRRSNFSFAAG